jgi:type II secretory pathway pseudopilin PulG
MNKQNGQTLLEVMLAIGIMIFGIISIISLSITSSVMARRTSKELIATQLAREGLEAVRNIRDGNWLEIEDGITGVNWYDGIYNATDSTAIALFSTTTVGGNWTINFTPNSLTQNSTKIYSDGDNIYRHKLPSETLTETPYRRLLTITQILDGTDFVGLNVKSEVQWNDGGTKSKILEENLYDWKAR